MEGEASHAGRQIARATGVVMIGLLLSNLVGLARQMLILRAFGTSGDLDAFFAAQRLPQLLFSLAAGGALASAFVPAFTSLLTRRQAEAAWRLASSVASLVFVLLAAIAALAALAAPWLVRNVIAPGFVSPQQQALTVSVLRVMLLTPMIFGLSGLLMGILNAHQHFLLPALAPAFYSGGIIFGLFVWSPQLGVHGLAWGTVLGAALHLAVQLPGLRGKTPQFTPGLGLDNPEVRQVGRLMVPRLLGAAAVEINFLVNTIIASGQPEGSLTSLNQALMIMLMPQMVIAQALAIAAFPTFSAQVARLEWDALRRTLAQALRGILYLALPASVGLIVLRRPIVAMLFEGGAFDAVSTSLVAWALLWYAAGLVGHSLLEVVVRAFYAMKDTRTPVAVGVAAMSLNIVFSLVFAQVFLAQGWPPHGGLALANSLATALEAATLLVILRRRLGGLELREIRPGATATLISSAIMTLILLGWLSLTRDRSPWLVGAAGVILGAAVFYTVSRLLGAPEAKLGPALLRERLRASP
ncbi:MAG TPA: murein biosynthesis integral membrane protein MurJ [Anaerolineales bacterium]|nr:murein biosynthesis integral membrane protein MurJ [Anaerolineales bacterium]